MVSNLDSRRAAVKAELIAGITRCGGVVSGEQCGRVHGESVKSAVSNHTFTVVFSKAVVVEGLVVPLCAVCARKAGPEAVAIDEAVRLAEQQLATTPVIAQVAPKAATPKVLPAPVMPAVGRVPAVRKDALGTLLAARPQPVASRQPREQSRGKDERKTKGGGRRREPQLSRSMIAHLECLASSDVFAKLFHNKKGEWCACGACEQKPGVGFATVNGSYAGDRFPLCQDGVDAGVRVATKLRSERKKPAFLIFRDEADWQDFDARIRSDAERNEKRGQAILTGQLGNDNSDTCAVFFCRNPKPEDRVAMFDEKHNFFVEHRICATCAKAARRFTDKMRQYGKRWAFQLLRGNQQLSPQQQLNLRRATKQAHKEPAAMRTARAAAVDKSIASRTKHVARPTPSVGSGTFGEKLVAAGIEAQKAKTAAPQPAPSEPEAVAAPASSADEPAAEPTIASTLAAAPEAPITPPEEGAMGGGAS